MTEGIVKIGFTGDFCPMGRIEEKCQGNEWENYFREIEPIFFKNDLNIIDLECPLTIAENKIVKTGPHIKASPITAKILDYLNCKLVVTANNHFKDYGLEGMLETYSVLKSLGVDWCGSGESIGQASKPKEFEINGLKFVLLNMTENEWTTTNGIEPGCNPIDFPRSLRLIQEAKVKGTDFVIVVLHGGHEHYPLPSPRMKAQFRFMVDAGADAVVGHHTHIISGYEVYKEKPIFYSLGNFCFDWPGLQNSTWNKGMILRLIFDKKSGVQFEYNLVQQNDSQIGVRIMDEHSYTEQLNELKRLNEIIGDDDELTKAFSKYAETLRPIMLSRIQPYRHWILVALHKRGFLPDIMRVLKKRMIKILVQCESHREVLLHVLNNSK